MTKFVDSIRFGLFSLVTVVHFNFNFFYWFSIFPGYHYVGGRGVLKVETKKWQSQGQSSPLVSWTAALSKPMHHTLILKHLMGSVFVQRGYIE